MKRGADESAIESMAEAADPVVLSKSGSEFIELHNYVLTINWIYILINSYMVLLKEKWNFHKNIKSKWKKKKKNFIVFVSLVLIIRLFHDLHLYIFNLVVDLF